MMYEFLSAKRSELEKRQLGKGLGGKMTSRTNQTVSTPKIIDLDQARRRLRYIALAMSNPDWLEIVASFHISGLRPTDEQAILAGRMIAGEASLEQVTLEIIARHYGGLQINSSDE
jgi:hypothetical protein